MDTPARLDVVEVFASKGRTKILHLLIQETEMNISRIVKLTHLNHRNVQNHLRALIGLGFVEEKVFGWIKVYRYRVEDNKVNALKGLVEFWENKLVDVPSLVGGITRRA